MKLLPDNIKGKEITATASASFDDERSAIEFFDVAARRLLEVNNWNKLAGSMGATFQLTDGNGTEISRPARPGDHLRIDIPGPGSKAGEGYDWVRIEEMEQETDAVGFLVRPASNPHTADDHIAHFYAEHSTSTFVVMREATVVTASVYDRNIEANEETVRPVDKLRNAVVGLGAKHGGSKLQWEALVKGLLSR